MQIESTTNWFKYSCYSLGLAALAAAAIPIGWYLRTRNNQGWDDLDNDLTYVFICGLVIIFFLITSFFTGLKVIKQRKIVAIWVVPIGIAMLCGIGGVLFAIYIHYFSLY